MCCWLLKPSSTYVVHFEHTPPAYAAVVAPIRFDDGALFTISNLTNVRSCLNRELLLSYDPFQNAIHFHLGLGIFHTIQNGC